MRYRYTIANKTGRGTSLNSEKIYMMMCVCVLCCCCFFLFCFLFFGGYNSATIENYFFMWDWSACIFCRASQEKTTTYILQKPDCQDRWYLWHTVQWVSARCLGEMWPSQNVISQEIMQNKFIRNSRDFGQSLKPQNTCDDKSTFVLVMTCCC